MEMWMTDKERNFFIHMLKPDDIYLEWGSGGSTIEVLPKVKHLISIEHDKEWYIKTSKKLSEIGTHYSYDYYLVEPDKPRSFPHVKREEFETYINKVHEIDKTYDKVLIDGRARVWCAEEVREHLNPGALVFIHDWVMRPFYHQILQWYKLVGLRDQMSVLRLK